MEITKNKLETMLRIFVADFFCQENVLELPRAHAQDHFFDVVTNSFDLATAILAKFLRREGLPKQKEQSELCTKGQLAIKNKEKKQKLKGWRDFQRNYRF